MKYHNRKISKYIFAAVLVLAGCTFLFPLVWLFISSFKTSREVVTNPLGLPTVWHFENYARAVEKFDFATYFMNSVVYTGLTVGLTLFCVTLFTYATARMQFSSSPRFQKLVQFGLAIPGGALLLGIYTLLLRSGLKNTYAGMVLVYTGHSIPFAAVILYGFFRSLPYSLEEAAALDGAGTLRTFFSIILPMVSNAVGTVAVITAMEVWNEYTIAYICTDKMSMKSLPVGVASFMSQRGDDYSGMAAAMMLAIVPTVFLYLLYSEKLENTLTTSAANK